MDLTEAKTHVKQLAADVAAFRDYEARTLQLLDRPDALQQSSFGVCGLAAVVRSLLAADDKARFAALLDAIFRGRPFRDITVVPAGKLLAGRERQWQSKVTHERQLGLEPPEPLYAFDFVAARALGKLLKERSKAAYELALLTSEDISATYRAKPGDQPVRLFELPVGLAADLDAGRISEPLASALRTNERKAVYLYAFSIDPAGAGVEVVEAGRRWYLRLVDASRRLLVTHAGDHLDVAYDAYHEAFEAKLVYQAAVNSSVIYQKDGDLALDPDSLAKIMTAVVGAASCTWTALTAAAPDAAVAAINAQFDQPRPYVYGFVNGVTGWLDGVNDPGGAFAAPPAPPTQLWGHSAPVGAHILAITGRIIKGPAHYRVPCWTWGTAYTAAIPHAHLAGYLAGCTHGQL